MEEVTQSELEQLQKLRDEIAQVVLPKEYLEDRDLVRWLRARSHNLKEAENMIRNHAKWLEKSEEFLNFEAPPEWKKEYPWGFIGFAHSGSPVLFAPVGLWDTLKAVESGEKESLIRYSLTEINRAWRVCKSLSAEKVSLAQLVCIYDMKGLPFRQITSLQDVCVTIIRLVVANYPELIQRIFVLNAPSVFHMLWRLLQTFMSERTHSKITFLSSDVNTIREQISKLVPLHVIPSDLGGSASNEILENLERNLDVDGLKLLELKK